MIPEFGWLSDQGQGKKFIKLSFSHKHSVNCQTLHDDTTQFTCSKYHFTSSVTLNIFQGYSSIRQFEVKIIAFLINDVYTAVFTFFQFYTGYRELHQLFIMLHTSVLKTSAKMLEGKYSFRGTSQRTVTTIKLAINFGTAFVKAVWYTSSLTLN